MALKVKAVVIDLNRLKIPTHSAGGFLSYHESNCFWIRGTITLRESFVSE